MHYNIYNKELDSNELSQKKYRSFVGGLWKELGELQLEFLINKGLQKEDNVLDLGCGALRGGIRIIRFLEKEHYYGLDINHSLIKAAKIEIKENNLEEKKPKLALSNNFDASGFGVQFDVILSVSLFTHLPFSKICECLKNIQDTLKPKGRYFTSFFEAEKRQFSDAIIQKPTSTVTYPDQDPFHQTFESFEKLAVSIGLQVDYVGDWKHPRNQKMLCFTKAKA